MVQETKNWRANFNNLEKVINEKSEEVEALKLKIAKNEEKISHLEKEFKNVVKSKDSPPSDSTDSFITTVAARMSTLEEETYFRCGDVERKLNNFLEEQRYRGKRKS